MQRLDTRRNMQKPFVRSLCFEHFGDVVSFVALLNARPSSTSHRSISRVHDG